MESFPPPKGEVTAEEILVRLIKEASIYFFKDKQLVINWAQRELDIVQSDEQLKMFEGEG